MSFYILLIASLNFLLCTGRLLWAFRNARVIAIVWCLITYHSFFLLLLVIEGGFITFKGFSGVSVKIGEDIIGLVCIFVLVFNIIFCLVEVLAYKIFRPKAAISWDLPKKNKETLHIQIVLLGCLIGGGIFYWLNMQGLGYRDYVEYSGSNWAVVFLWASSPLITLLVLQRRYSLAIIAVLPFVIFAFYLHIRSFLLLSMIPAIVVVFFQHIVGNSNASFIRKNTLLAIFIVVLTLISSLIIKDKTGKEAFSLPDSELVYSMNLVFKAESREKLELGFNSLYLYGSNLMNPFFKLGQIIGIIDRRSIIDTPVYMARIVNGVPLTSKVYFHYPTLWYSDAYISFGLHGLWLAFFWGVILVLLEIVMCRTPMYLALILPFYVWHNYMLVRGSIAGAAAPFSYAFYLSYLIFFFTSLITKDKKSLTINNKT